MDITHTYNFSQDSYEQWAVTAETDLRDEQGRLLDRAKMEAENHKNPEDLDVFISGWIPQRMASSSDWAFASRFVFPEIENVVVMKRLDLFECSMPRTQQASINPEESLRIRRSEGWFPVKSFFVLDQPMLYTKPICIETCGPPRRHRFRPFDKTNSRDLSHWVPREQVHAYFGADRIPGACDVFVDYTDSPDRYFLSTDISPEMGYRRLFRFAAYPATQYYILEKRVQHDCLEAEGGFGMTYTIESGPSVFACKGWKIIGSFFGMDQPLLCTNQYHIYKRNDPFPRMQIAMGPIDDAHEWTYMGNFYAWDIALGGTCQYTLDHCSRSIHSIRATVVRHRLSCGDSKKPWDFRLSMYVFPASLEECSFTASVYE